MPLQKFKVSLATSHTPAKSSLHYETTDMGLVHCVVDLFTPQLLLVLIVFIHGRKARLSLVGWLSTTR